MSEQDQPPESKVGNIIPTVGRIVLCYQRDQKANGNPLPGIILHAFGNDEKSMCSILMFGDGKHDNGGCNFHSPIYAADCDNLSADHSCWATWMPYQMGQAEKTQALEDQMKRDRETSRTAVAGPTPVM